MENEKQEPFDYEKAKQKVNEEFRTGKSLYGKDGAFAPLLQDIINSIAQAMSSINLTAGAQMRF